MRSEELSECQGKQELLCTQEVELNEYNNDLNPRRLVLENRVIEVTSSQNTGSTAGVID